jgi:hypothetical protein
VRLSVAQLLCNCLIEAALVREHLAMLQASLEERLR